MSRKLLVVALLALMAVSMLPVQAGNITVTMSNPGGIAIRDIIVYFPNGTMYGYYNSTSVIDLDTNSSYIFTMKPLSGNPLEDPGDFLSNEAFPWVQSNFVSLIALAFVVVLATRGL